MIIESQVQHRWPIFSLSWEKSRVIGVQACVAGIKLYIIGAGRGAWMGRERPFFKWQIILSMKDHFPRNSYFWVLFRVQLPALRLRAYFWFCPDGHHVEITTDPWLSWSRFSLSKRKICLTWDVCFPKPRSANMSMRWMKPRPIGSYIHQRCIWIFPRVLYFRPSTTKSKPAEETFRSLAGYMYIFAWKRSSTELLNQNPY